uniref:Uncharacterized protein n=1 Tax=Amphimedon queenslandica TaxID=400682 RepID=A0A1X7T251_AMPQE
MQKCINWYNKNKDSKILKSTCYSQTNYRINPDHKKEASRNHYQKIHNPRKKQLGIIIKTIQTPKTVNQSNAITKIWAFKNKTPYKGITRIEMQYYVLRKINF